MLGQVKKLVPPDFPARFGAWWDGRDYAPPADMEDAPAAQEAAEPAPAEAAPPRPKPAPDRVGPPVSAAPLRIRALEALWGEGRFTPGSDTLDRMLLDAAFETADGTGSIGFIGADPALLSACRGRSDRPIHACEWRAGCTGRVGELLPGLAVEQADVDRPRGLPEGGLAALVSFDAFAYADHKAGLATRAFKALGPSGRWVAVDTVRHTKKTPPEPFASAFAEPMLGSIEETEDVLRLAGFRSVRRESLTQTVLEAAARRYQAFAVALEDAVREAVADPGGALFLQELTWEAHAWRARMRALSGGALSLEMWVADKGEGGAKPAADAADPLFDPA